MDTKKKKYIILAAVCTFICLLTAILAVWKMNKYYLELSVAEKEISLEYGVDQMPEVTALCKGTLLNRKGTSVNTTMTGKLNLKQLGTYEVTYSAKYKNVELFEKRIIIIKDTTAPEIKLISNPECFTSPVGTYEEEGFSAIDNYDGDITDKVTREEKDGVITYTVVDSSGNKATVDRTILYKDAIAPTITLTNGSEIHFTIGQDFSDPGFAASDDVDGDLTEQVTVTGTVDGHKAGTYTLTYAVSDSSGNKTEAARTVKVGDFTAPTIILNGAASSYIKIGTAFSEPGYSASDNIDGDITSKVNVSGSVDINTMGRYTITYTVADSFGNSTSATRSIFVYKQQAVSNTINPGDKVVYLTFDDGPGRYTQQLLDTLDKYNVKVTFFVTNQFPAYQNLIGEAHRRGHTIGLHTYSHQYQNIYTSETAYFNDLEAIKNVCIAQTGIAPSIIRFPGGTSNTVSRKYCSGIMTLLSQTVSYHGYLYTDWNVSSGDAGGAKTSTQVFNNVTNGIRNRSVSNVLMHDIQKQTVDAIDSIIFWGLQNGYTFLPLDTTSPMVHFNPQN